MNTQDVFVLLTFVLLVGALVSYGFFNKNKKSTNKHTDNTSSSSSGRTNEE